MFRRTELEKVIECFPDNSAYNFIELSCNPSISMDFIELYKHKYKWNWKRVILNPNLTMKFIKDNLNKSLNFDIIIRNIFDMKYKYLCINDIYEHIELFKERVKSLELYSKLDDIQHNYSTFIVINNYCFCQKHGLIDKDCAIDVLRNTKRSGYLYNYMRCNLSKNENITMEDIHKNMDIEWDWMGGVSKNPNLTLDFVRKHIDKQWWSFYDIAMNRNITMKNISDNIDLFIDVPYIWSYISMNPNLTIEFVKKHIDKEWCWFNITVNENITMDDIYKNKELPWDWNYISLNKNINCDDIIRLLSENGDNKKHLWLISNNHFKYYDRTKVICYWKNMEERTYKEKNAVIKNELLEVSWKPERVIDWCLDIDERKGLMCRWFR